VQRRLPEPRELLELPEPPQRFHFQEY